MMHLFLMRHADAAYTSPDSHRALSQKGQKQVEALAAFVRPKLFTEVQVIMHSPLVRARETAEILREEAPLNIPLKEQAGLCPMDDPEVVAHLALESREDLFFVGHNPHMERLAMLLLGGAMVEFKKSTLLCLERISSTNARQEYGQWALQWHLSPKLFKIS